MLLNNQDTTDKETWLRLVIRDRWDRFFGRAYVPVFSIIEQDPPKPLCFHYAKMLYVAAISAEMF